MTKDDDTDNNKAGPPSNSTNSPSGKGILGHKMTIHGLNNQVCFQWCQQQQCSIYCFKHTKSNDSDNDKTVSDNLTLNETTTMNDTGRIFKDLVSNYMAAPLKKYSIVVIKGTDDTTDKYMEVTNGNDPLATQEPTRNQYVHEINIGDKAEAVLENAEITVKKAHQYSQDLYGRWQNNIGFDYSGTLHIMKDRAMKMMDVARGKYDDIKKPPKDSTKDNDKPDDNS
ncbi:hypothetical protein BC941DRAFT_471994 [Chlamydoabsidia padenii]|nr:hypothetical protein BC941DRAFT_471994 [Chlamydoabsidia padenii]